MARGHGTATLPNRAIGYLEMKAGRTTYHLVIPRAFGAFTCGQNQVIKRDRVVIIGDGDPESAEIETANTVLRMLASTGSVMKGAFESTKSRGQVRYEYKISWSVTREVSARTRRP
jgi:hypothetical protein